MEGQIRNNESWRHDNLDIYHCVGSCVLNSCCAFSTSHSTQRALPAMSLNSAPGSGERMSVAMEHGQIRHVKICADQLTSEDHAKVSGVHKVAFTPLTYPMSAVN